MRSTLLALILAAGHCLLPRLSAAGGADEPPRSAPGSSTLLGRSLNLAADWLNQERPRLQFINGSKQTVDIFWLKSATERVPNGSLDPGEKKVIPTTLGHQFSVVGRDDKTEAAVTSEVVIQGFRFDPPSKTGVPAFYTQSLSAEGFPIVASANVNPYALQEVA